VILPRSSDPERQARNINLEGLQLSSDDMGEINDLRNKQKSEAFKQCWNPENII
jgi:diketogulonate reductase-like aldo/keto reductase